MAVNNVFLDFVTETSTDLLYEDPLQDGTSWQVAMQSAGLNSGLIQTILSRLTKRFSATSLVFTTSVPATGSYHTVHIGNTDSFSDTAYASFTSLAEKSDGDTAAEAFVNLTDLPQTDTVIADQIETVTRVLTEGASSSTGTIADYAATAPLTEEPAIVENSDPVAAEPAIVDNYSDPVTADDPLPAPAMLLAAPANTTVVYEATAENFAQQLQAAKANELAGNDSILKLTGGSFGNQNVFADGIEFLITGGSVGAKNYFYGGIDLFTKSDDTLVPQVFSGNVTLAASAATARGVIAGGKFLVTATPKSYTGTATALTVSAPAEEGTTVVERLAGGAFVTADPSQFGPQNARFSVDFDSSLTVSTDQIAVTAIAVGGSIIAGSANMKQTGNSSLTISGGTFDTVAGGNYLQHINAGTTLIGNSSVVVTGGTFSGSIFGGHLSFYSGANDLLEVDGDVSVTIDCSENEICFGSQSSIVAGSSSSSTDKLIWTGIVSGNATVTFRGSAENLKGFCGTVWGDCGMSVTYTDGSWDDHVDNSSILVFDDFVCTDQAAFKASRICCFDTWTVSGNSHVVLTGGVNAMGVNDWNISWNEGSSEALVFDNIYSKADFRDDNINLIYDGTQELTKNQSWTVVKGKNADFFANFSSASNVDLFGEMADYDLNKKAYISDSYKLELKTQGEYTAMVVTRTA